jgi:transcriptional regulator with XRE-family HTH domain
MGGRREISSRDCEISATVERMLRLAAKRGFSLKVLALETGIPESTLGMYLKGTAMPLATFARIVAVKGFPNELASLPFDGASKALVDAEPDETDLDDAAVAAAKLVLRYVEARHKESPGGIRIVHSEEPDLRLHAACVVEKAGKVAA